VKKYSSAYLDCRVSFEGHTASTSAGTEDMQW